MKQITMECLMNGTRTRFVDGLHSLHLNDKILVKKADDRSIEIAN